MYGLIISASLVFCTLLIEQQLNTKDRHTLWKLVFFMLIGGVIGARFYHVIHLRDFYINFPLSAFAIWQGGLGIIGGILGALSVFFLVSYMNKLDYLTWLDRFAFMAPLGHALGRMANVVNKELLPYAIYESVFMGTIFLFYQILKKKASYRGKYSGLYLLSYGTARILLEPIKQDAWDFGNIYVAQIFGFLFVISGVCIIYANKKR